MLSDYPSGEEVLQNTDSGCYYSEVSILSSQLHSPLCVNEDDQLTMWEIHRICPHFRHS